MKLAHCFFCTVLLSASSLAYPLSYDSAVYAAQKGNWKEAHETLNNILTNNPDNAAVVYDAGVAAHNLGNASQAAACFTRAAECTHHDDKSLCCRSHFNAGNAYVDDKNLRRALEQYDKALAIEPDNEHARHNHDRVAQMLQESSSAKASKDKQEKQQDQQKKDDQKKEDDKKDNKNNKEQDQGGNDDKSGDDNNDQPGDSNDQQQQNGDQSGGKKNKQGNDQSSSAKATEDRSDQKSQGDHGDGTEDGDKDAQRKEHGNNEQQQKKSTENKQWNGDHELDEKTKSEQSEGDKQQGNQHNQTPEKQNGTNDKSNVASEGGQEQGKDEGKYGEIDIDDPWLLNVLNNQELRDKAVNKQLMEAKVRQHGGKNGQNCW